MPSADSISFTHYLTAKKTVDDRALNLPVWDTLATQLYGISAPLRVLEVGAGIGTMVVRALERGLFPMGGHYIAVDSHPGNTAAATPYMQRWAVAQGVAVSDSTGGHLSLDTGDITLTVEFQTADAFHFIRNELEPASCDVLIANAFIDLVHIPTALPVLFSALKPGGLFYFTITFDGITAFEPPIDPELDARIERLYHADMENRRWQGHPTGGSEAGRRLLRALLQDDGVDLLAAGPSDWIVVPLEGRYPADEAAFLHFIIHTIDNALTGHPDLPAAQFKPWISRRHEQVDRGDLVYMAHQLDVLGRIKKEPDL